MRRLAMQPIGCTRVTAAADAQPAMPITTASLSRTPRTIHALWQEYEFGTGGRKAAKDFTMAERGKVKYT